MYPVRRQTSPHAARFHRERTGCENSVWQALRNRQRERIKFRFQATIGRFVVDFLCIEAKPIIEVDSSQHNETSDAARTTWSEASGYRVLRFRNSDVVENREGVPEAIRLAPIDRMADKKNALLQPPPAKAGGGF